MKGIKNIISLWLLLLFPVLIEAQEKVISLEAERDWAYYVEMMDLTLKIPLEDEAQVIHTEVEVLTGKIDLFDSYEIDSFSYSVIDDKYEEFYKEVFRVVTLHREEVSVQVKVEFSDGTILNSNPITFRIKEHPVTELDYFVLCNNLWTENLKPGDPASVLVEVFSIDGLRKDPILPITGEFLKVDTAEALDSRIVYIKGSYHQVESFPLRVTFFEQGEYNLLPQEMYLEFYDEETGKNYKETVPVLQNPVIVVEEDDEKHELSLPDLETESRISQENWTKGESVGLTLTLKSEGDLSEISTLEEYSDFPSFLEEQTPQSNFIWDNDRVIEVREFNFAGTVPGKTGVSLDSVEIDFFTPEGEAEKARIDLGRMQGNHHPAAIIAFYCIMILTAVALGFFVIISVKKIKKDPKKKEVKTELQDIYLFAEEFQLTNRERDVLKVLVDGKSTKEIADMLYISPDTAKKHINNIMGKTETHSRLEIYVLLDKYIKKKS